MTHLWKICYIQNLPMLLLVILNHLTLWPFLMFPTNLLSTFSVQTLVYFVILTKRNMLLLVIIVGFAVLDLVWFWWFMIDVQMFWGVWEFFYLWFCLPLFLYPLNWPWIYCVHPILLGILNLLFGACSSHGCSLLQSLYFVRASCSCGYFLWQYFSSFEDFDWTYGFWGYFHLPFMIIVILDVISLFNV